MNCPRESVIAFARSCSKSAIEVLAHYWKVELHMPRVSIGLPVYNGEKYLEQALKSLLAQALNDFELIIGDNGSTDRTEEICLAFAERDPRISYYRHESNLGAAYNFNFVFTQAEAPYFKWASYDDICAPEFLGRCVAALDADPGLVLCHTRTGIIDENGELLKDDTHVLRLDSPKSSVRFHDLCVVRHPCVIVFGVIRSEILAKTPLIGSYVGSDRVLLGELGLHGRMCQLPERLFFRRRHGETSWWLDERNERLAWFDPNKVGSITFPNWRILLEHIASVHRVPQQPRAKINCYLNIITHLRTRRIFLWRDLHEALKLFVRKKPGGEKLIKTLKAILKPRDV